MSDEELAPSYLPSGRVVGGRYQLASVIGEGAQSVVYLGQRLLGGDPVALKVLHPRLCGDPQLVQRFHREAKILGKLEGEHIVRLLEFIEEDGLLIIALEHITGITLEALLEERAPLEVQVATEITLQVCAALETAHANGVIHRDLKPANVLIERGAAEGPHGLRVKVVDFGLGKVIHGEQVLTGLTEQGMIFGTPEYMAPEMARGEELDTRADLYAAGIMLYEMTVGRVPFQQRSAIGTMTAHLSEPPPRPREARRDLRISAALEAVMLRALAKNPADRYASARELAQALLATRHEPLVVAPSGMASSLDFGVGDTDPHLEQAATLRADELAKISHVKPTVVVRSSSTTPPPTPHPKRAALQHQGTTTPEPTRAWVVVAVVAALVAIAVGAFVGMR